jgi:hypothetical protein
MTKLARMQVETLLKEADESFPLGLCPTCECFLGYVAQLHVDADIDSRDLLKPYKVDRNLIHNCLGCDPCPPGDLYIAYQRNKQASQGK